MKLILNFSSRQLYRIILLVLLHLVLSDSQLWAQLSGNPLFSGADPEIHYFNNKYYIYPTTVNGKQFHAHSSDDLTNWKDEGVIFDIGPQCTWGEVNGWAPSVVYKNNQYYFYYVAEVKIGVAIGNSPTGPFTDLGYPLIGSDPYTKDIIDPMVFTDDDGQIYIYYGGSNGSRMVMRKLNQDMISFASGPVDITPPNYTEGPFMVKRNGTYYMMYSNGAWYNDTYNVRYSTSNSPAGPWTYHGKILESNVEDKGPGHHAVLKMGDCDEYYIIYHRYENGLTGGRKVCIDHMYFNSSGLIDPVNMTNYGVQARVPDNSCLAHALVSGGVYRLTHKGTNQCLDVLYNSSSSGTNVEQYTDNGNDAQRWIITLESDGYYKLTHKGTNQCLDVVNNSHTAGTNVQQYTDNGSDAQRWKLEAMSDGYFKLTHKGTNLCLDVDNNSSAHNANVQQWTDNGNNAQRWKLDLIEVPIVSGGLYKLTHKGTDQCLDASGNSSASGANVQQYTDDGNDSQRWYVTLQSDGYYKLMHKGTNECLDVAGNSSQAGANVQQWIDNGNDAQRWKMELMSDGYFKLTHKGTTQCLDVGNNLAEPGTNVGQWNDNGNDAQRWKLDLMPDVSPVNGNGDGLTGSYFNGMNFETPVLSRKDAKLDMGWGSGSPGTGVNSDKFSVRWTGQVQPRYSGDYTFYINSDNGRRVWVGDQLIIDQWIDNWNVTYSGKITLKAGQKYDFKVEYFENTGGAGIKLEWSSLFQQREVIPTSQLYSNPVPSVSITSPSNNATYNTPVNFSLNANASDNVSISKVDFFKGTTLVGSDNATPYSANISGLTPGNYTFKAIAYDNQGAFAISSNVSVNVTSDSLAGNGNGLSGNYFNGMNFETLVYSGTDASLNMNWGLGSPNAAVNSNQFSARWTGLVQPKYSGEYTFYINSDNGRRVWVNNQLIIDQWIDNWNIEYSGKITLTAGQKYDIKVEYFENDGGASIKLYWSSADQTKEIIPTSQLYSNPLPSVSVSSSSTNITGPANLILAASASDVDGVSKVEFYNGSTLLGSDNTAPYSYAWNNVSVGTYTVTAIATDSKGGETRSSAVTVKVNSSVNTPPSISITSPVNNVSYDAPASITINANASDSDGSISKVEFYNGSSLLGTDNTAPYSLTWSNVAAGTYIITSKAYDNNSASATSSGVTVKVNAVSTDLCSSIPQYVENGGYVDGSKVKNAGNSYQCKPYPYTGWCNGAAWAYAPGTGSYWTDAWILLGSCNSPVVAPTAPSASTTSVSFSPNPATDVINLNIDQSVKVTIYNNMGSIVIPETTVPANGSLDIRMLNSGIYSLKIDTGSSVVMQSLIKN